VFSKGFLWVRQSLLAPCFIALPVYSFLATIRNCKLELDNSSLFSLFALAQGFIEVESVPFELGVQISKVCCLFPDV